MKALLILLFCWGSYGQQSSYDKFLERQNPTPYMVSVPSHLLLQTETLQSFGYINWKGENWLVLETSFYKDQYKNFKSVLKYLDPLLSIDPVISAGLVYNFEKKPLIFLSLKSYVTTSNNQGFGFKLTVYSESYKKLLDKQSGSLSTFYFKRYTNAFKTKDILMLYAGWTTDNVEFSLNSLSELQKSLSDIKKQKDGLTLGGFYNWNVLKATGVNIELGFDKVLLGINIGV